MPIPYFRAFENRKTPKHAPMSIFRTRIWHTLAGATVGLGAWYLHWRWTASLNPDAMVFSILVVATETLCYLGTLLFFFDIWEEGDTPVAAPPENLDLAGVADLGDIAVDLYITTYDEEYEVVRPSIEAARQMQIPNGTHVSVFLLDDGNRPEMRALAEQEGATYLARDDNEGFKAGNLRNALMQTRGDFVAICDADTRVEPGFLANTLGYFRDPQVAWVQTPHWFYDIPEGQSWESWIAQNLSPRLCFMAPALAWISGTDRVGVDPFLSDPIVFFDVIQRRRNRNGASFCCGAGSIHRREAIFSVALKRKNTDLTVLSQRLSDSKESDLLEAIPLQPFRFHVSEDIYTSMLLQEDQEAGWKSVFHPHPEARMLSPWTIGAWATQKLKYAGGTFDIMLRDNPLWRRGMPWRTKLHYLATFWSYLSVLWLPILLMAPVFSLVTGIAPVEAYSATFFAHFIPVIVLSELAVLAACKGHAVQSGRQLAIATLPIQLRAFWMVLRGQRPKFPPTPKTPVLGEGRHHILPNIWLLAVMAGAGIYGTVMTLTGSVHHDMSLLTVNLFWLAWNMLAIGRIVWASFWTPPASPSSHYPKEHTDDAHLSSV